ncbi:MAG TPA: SDR family NAD(P)-dependent oxidoreductase [Glaciibacter sp.]|nr:SDR family NAD(P)-dependent oxidoreductase [Glaciibacter sp.]
MTWNPAAPPSQLGKTFVVTGANAGLGYFTSEQLAAAGAHVVLACRNADRADAALGALRRRVPGASVSALRLDVSDLSSVAAAADELRALPRIDGLILNAGTVHPPRRRAVSVDGHELVLATNYLGHFALTAQVLPALLSTHGSRIIPLGSMISRLLDMPLDDLQLVTGYNRWKAYAQSKIAMQVFGFELDRRLGAAGADTQAIVVHPGYSISGRTPRITGVSEPSRADRFVDNLQAAVTQGKDRGAWAIVRAATDSTAVGGQFYGPRFVTKGAPVTQRPTRTSLDTAVASHLWAQSETLSGVRFPL